MSGTIARLAGKVVLVTGGAQGMGTSHVQMMIEEGARVVVADIAEEVGEALASHWPDACLFCPLDVTDEEQWQEVAQTAVKHFGRIDALVNNAGVLMSGTVLGTSARDFRRVIDINLTGTFLGMQAVAPHMTEGGVIVNLSSVAGLAGFRSSAAYVASKWGVRGLTKAAALDLADRSIRVVSVHPGPIRTPMANIPSEALKRRPIPRIGEPGEVSRMIIFLIAEATFSTGSEFVIDGGRSASFG